MQEVSEGILDAIEQLRPKKARGGLINVLTGLLEGLEKAKQKQADAAKAVVEIQDIAAGLHDWLKSQNTYGTRNKNDNATWTKFQNVATSQAAKNERSKEDAVMNYAFLRMAWGKKILEKYQWTPKIGQNTLRHLKICARFYATFADFAEAANRLVLRRHHTIVLEELGVKAMTRLSKTRLNFRELTCLAALTRGNANIYGFTITRVPDENEVGLIASWADRKPSAMASAYQNKTLVSKTLQDVHPDYLEVYLLEKDEFGVFIDKLSTLNNRSTHAAATPSSVGDAGHRSIDSRHTPPEDIDFAAPEPSNHLRADDGDGAPMGGEPPPQQRIEHTGGPFNASPGSRQLSVAASAVSDHPVSTSSPLTEVATGVSPSSNSGAWNDHTSPTSFASSSIIHVGKDKFPPRSGSASVHPQRAVASVDEHSSGTITPAHSTRESEDSWNRAEAEDMPFQTAIAYQRGVTNISSARGENPSRLAAASDPLFVSQHSVGDSPPSTWSPSAGLASAASQTPTPHPGTFGLARTLESSHSPYDRRTSTASIDAPTRLSVDGSSTHAPASGLTTPYYQGQGYASAQRSVDMGYLYDAPRQDHSRGEPRQLQPAISAFHASDMMLVDDHVPTAVDLMEGLGIDMQGFKESLRSVPPIPNIARYVDGSEVLAPAQLPMQDRPAAIHEMAQGNFPPDDVNFEEFLCDPDAVDETHLNAMDVDGDASGTSERVHLVSAAATPCRATQSGAQDHQSIGYHVSQFMQKLGLEAPATVKRYHYPLGGVPAEPQALRDPKFLEERNFKDHVELIQHWLEVTHLEADANPLCRARKLWLTAEREMAHIHVRRSSRREIPLAGFAPYYDDDADMHCLTATDFDARTQAGEAFTKPVLIYPAFADDRVVPDLEGVCDALYERAADKEITMHDMHEGTAQISVADFLEVVRQGKRSVATTDLRREIKPLLFELTHLTRFDVLNRAATAIFERSPRECSIESDVFDATSLTQISTPGFFSGPFTHGLGGACLRVIVGALVVIFIKPENTCGAATRAVRDGTSFDPLDGGRTWILVPGIVLWIPVGHPYVTITLKTAVIVGQVLCDAADSDRTLVMLSRVVDNPASCFPPLPDRLPQVVQEMTQMGAKNADRYHAGQANDFCADLGKFSSYVLTRLTVK